MKAQSHDQVPENRLANGSLSSKHTRLRENESLSLAQQKLLSHGI